ncbi:MAG: hypothetical protein V1806_17275 [Pseudomonadota bacterium]
MDQIWRGVDQRKRMNVMGWLVLLAGLGCALLVYIAAEYDSPNPGDDQDGYASTYSLNPENSKKFIHDMEVYGGKANVLMYKFRVWFEGLWHGQPLAYTIACLTVLVAGMIFYVSGFLAPPPRPPDPGEGPRPSPPE